MRVSAALFLLLTCCSAAAQEVVLKLPPQPKPAESPGHSFSFPYRINGNQVKTRLGTYSGIIYPHNFDVKDTAFVQEYFVGYPGKAVRGISILVADYKSSLPTLYIDQNNNLDFSDDGEPLKMASGDTSAFLTFHNKENPEATFSIKYWKTEISKPEELDKMLGTANLREQGLPVLLPEYWFSTRRHNNRITKTMLGNDSVKVALHDYNCNGYFDDEGEDRIFIAPVEIPFYWRQKAGAFILENDSNLFVLNDEVYEVVSVDSLGRSIIVRPSELEYDPPIAAGRKIPEITFQLADGGDTSLNTFLDGKKYLLINMWGSWCKGCHSSADALKKVSEEYSEKLQILGLNTGEPLDKIRAFADKYGHDWPQGMLSGEIISTFLVEGYPTYVLVDPSGMIISLQSHPSEVRELLEDGE